MSEKTKYYGKFTLTAQREKLTDKELTLLEGRIMGAIRRELVNTSINVSAIEISDRRDLSHKQF